ncbi:porin [Nitrospinae bacterium AH_259_B05_G02_I21]|nr:porin [Nitrospinae bacterium AH_259_B05_G02_I21]
MDRSCIIRKVSIASVGALLVLFLATPGFPDQGTEEVENLKSMVQELKERVETLEQQAETAAAEQKSLKERIQETVGLKISGYVDTSFVWNANTEDLATSNATPEDADFSLDQVEIDLEKEITSWLKVRTDIDFEEADGSLTADEIFEQGFVVATIPMFASIDEDGWDVTVGKFNAPIGWELLDAPDTYQFSQSITFLNGIPTNLTGVMLQGNVTQYLDFAVYGVNGWDDDTSAVEDRNRDKTIGGRLGVTPFGELLNVGVSVIHGPESDPNADDPAEALAAAAGGQDNHDQRTVLDVDYTINLPILEGLIIGGEVNIGRDEHAQITFLTLPGQRPADAEWFGYFNTIHLDVLSWLGFTYRYDYFDDSSGARISSTPRIPQIWQSHTGAITVNFTESAGFVVEYRFDQSNLGESDVAPFIKKDGTRDDENSTIATEFTYSF